MSRINLYDNFKHWQWKGNIKIISDTHFNDLDRDVMGYSISSEEQLVKISKGLFPGDTLVHLGDVGDIKMMEKLKEGFPKIRFVLVTGNHDGADVYNSKMWDEVYKGPVFISPKILLSHEPILNACWLNVHGHDHSQVASRYTMWNAADNLDGTGVNLAGNVCKYEVFNLNNYVNSGGLKEVKSIHRMTIDKATEKARG